VQNYRKTISKEREIKTIADFPKKVLPASTVEQKVLPKSNLGTQTIRRSLPKSPILYEAPQIDQKSRPTTSDVLYETTTEPGTCKRGDADDGEDDKEVLNSGS
jgi:hypothetical protein